MTSNLWILIRYSKENQGGFSVPPWAGRKPTRAALCIFFSGWHPNTLVVVGGQQLSLVRGRSQPAREVRDADT